MTLEKITDQFSINQELSMLNPIDTYLSYSENNPSKKFFVSSDNTFTRKARLLQSIRRWQSGAEMGYREYKGIKTYHGNLAADGLTFNHNFFHREIFDYARARVDNKKKFETIDEKRLFCNLLSSQPMAFNLFYPLMKIVKTIEGLEVLAKCVFSLLDSSDSIKIGRIIEVGLEYIPDYYTRYMNDKTAMDAYFRYESSDGSRGIIAIETKYTDVLGVNEASKRQPALQLIRRDEVRCLFNDCAIESFMSGNLKITQVFRNFLLTESVRIEERLDDSISIILAPEDNNSNIADERLLVNALVDEYKYKFIHITLEKFIESLQNTFQIWISSLASITATSTSVLQKTC